MQHDIFVFTPDARAKPLKGYITSIFTLQWNPSLKSAPEYRHPQTKEVHHTKICKWKLPINFIF